MMSLVINVVRHYCHTRRQTDTCKTIITPVTSSVNINTQKLVWRTPSRCGFIRECLNLDNRQPSDIGNHARPWSYAINLVTTVRDNIINIRFIYMTFVSWGNFGFLVTRILQHTEIVTLEVEKDTLCPCVWESIMHVHPVSRGCSAAVFWIIYQSSAGVN